MKLALGYYFDFLGYFLGCSLGSGVNVSNLAYLPFLINLITIIIPLSALFCYKYPFLALSVVIFFKKRL